MLGWFARSRKLAKDYEFPPGSEDAWIYIWRWCADWEYRDEGFGHILNAVT